MQIPDHISASYIKNCYKNTSLSKSKSSKKLASGYRINTAADDAAKLSISEKMRAQIRGLDQASNNIQDSISFLQVADGALETASSIMQRIRELAVKAANDTYTDQDRDQIQQECNQLQVEMLSIFDQSTFHSKKIFKGGSDLISEEISECLQKKQLPLFDSEQLVSVDGKTIQGNVLNMLSASICIKAFASEVLEKLQSKKLQLDYSTKAWLSQNILYFLSYAKELQPYSDLPNYQACISAAEENIKQAIQDYQNGQDGKDKLWAARGPWTSRGPWCNDLLAIFYESGAMNRLTGAYIELILQLIYIPYEFQQPDTVGHPSEYAAYKLINMRLPVLYGKSEETDLAGTSLLESLKDNHYDTAFKTLAELSGMKECSLSLQSGANANQGLKMRVVISDIPKSPFQLSSYKTANASIDKADRFLTQLTAARAEIGAYQNRLESALSYTGQGAEALQNTESRMRDTNMAKEAADYAKTKLQNDFQVSFLAQKNTSRADVSVLSFPKSK